MCLLRGVLFPPNIMQCHVVALSLSLPGNYDGFLAGNACFQVGPHAICSRHGIKQGIICVSVTTPTTFMFIRSLLSATPTKDTWRLKRIQILQTHEMAIGDGEAALFFPLSTTRTPYLTRNHTTRCMCGQTPCERAEQLKALTRQIRGQQKSRPTRRLHAGPWVVSSASPAAAAPAEATASKAPRARHSGHPARELLSLHRPMCSAPRQP